MRHQTFNVPAFICGKIRNTENTCISIGSFCKAAGNKWIAIFLILINITVLKSQTPISFSPHQKQTLNIWEYCYLLEDKTNSLTFNTVRNDSLNHFFKPANGIPSTFGFTSSTYWIKFKTQTNKPLQLFFLTIERVSLWEADLFTLDSIGETHVEHLGVNLPYNAKSFQSKFAICELNGGRSKTYYLKVSAITSLFIPIYLDSPQSLSNKLASVDLFNGIYVGTFAIIILYNLIAYFLRKQTIYLWYLFYVLSLFIYQGLFNTGLGFQYLWPNWPEINRHYVVASSLFGISMIAFSAEFLSTKENLGQLHIPLYFFSAGFISLIVLSLMGYPFTSAKYFIWVLIPTFIYLTAIAIIAIKKGNANARFYLAGWGILLIFYFIFTLWLNGFIGDSAVGHRSLFLGSFFEMIFWFTAVSDKLNHSRNEQVEQEKQLRKEVARDFHDELGNRAARLINYIGLLSVRGTISKDIYENLSSHSQKILDGAKDFVWALDPINDNLNNVIIHLKDFGEQLLLEKDITFRFFGHLNENIKLPYGYSRQINLIFKEALTNAFKHSKASSVEMTVTFDNSFARITLKDNGIGVSNEVIENSIRGIANIRVRTQKIKSKVEIISSPIGTSISLIIPINYE